MPDHADPARRLIVGGVTLRDFRSYPRLELELEPGLVLVTGPNGSGKTNLLEALHVGTQGFSPRTRSDTLLIRHGAQRARIALTGTRDGVGTSTETTLDRAGPRRTLLNGAPVRSAEALRGEIATLVFTPDRLAVVKGGPAARRAYFDRVVARLLPSRAAVPVDYATAVGQRNTALRRVAAGLSSRDALAPWTEQVATLGRELVAARREAVSLLGPGAAETAADLGLHGLSLGYDAEAPTTEALESRLDRDLERGATGIGPHLHDIELTAEGRDLRSLGSQGEQRTAVIALLLGEAELLGDRRGVPPLVLLDDALSELDASRRRRLSERIGRRGQTVVTATGAEALPVAPAQLLVVSPGEVRPG